MKRYLLLHYGFEKPTPDIMAAWGKWFGEIKDCTVDGGGFHGAAREISSDGTADLPMDMNAITGFNIIEAESLEAAEKIAGANPYIASIRLYEIVPMG